MARQPYPQRSTANGLHSTLENSNSTFYTENQEFFLNIKVFTLKENKTIYVSTLLSNTNRCPIENKKNEAMIIIQE